MDPQFRRARGWVLGTAAVAVLGLIGSDFLSSNPERLALEREITRLDGQLMYLKMGARDPARYAAEVDAMRARIQEGRRSFAGDLEVLSSSLARSGVAIVAERDGREESGRSPSNPTEPIRLELRAGERDRLVAALTLLHPRISRLERFRLEPGGAWTLEVTLYALLPLPLPVDPPPPRARWYSSLNDDLRRLIASKRAQIEELRAKLGREDDFTIVQQELEALTKVIEGLAPVGDEHRELLRSLFVDAPIFESATVERSSSGFAARGTLAPGVETTSVQERLAPGWRVAQVNTHGRQVSLIAEPVAAPAEDR